MPQGRLLHVGGLVEQASVQHESDGKTVDFRITDGSNTVAVVYRGALPDLFREGQGVVVEGKLDGTGVVPRRQRAGEARRELHAARGRRCAEAERALAGRRAAPPAALGEAKP